MAIYLNQQGKIMGSFSIWHWLIVLVIVMLVFGTKKLRNIGADLGGAVKGFKEGIRESSVQGLLAEGKTIDSEIRGTTNR